MENFSLNYTGDEVNNKLAESHTHSNITFLNSISQETLDAKQDVLTAGDNITISNNTITAVTQQIINADDSLIINNGYISVNSAVIQEKISAGDNISVINNVISATYNEATNSSSGLMSAADKSKLDNTVTSSGTVTSVGINNANNGGLTITNSPITESGVMIIGHTNILNAAQETSGVYPITIDKNGHIVTYGEKINIPTTASDVNAVEANADITAGTATKITYDTKGLVTSGTSLSASDIPDLSATYATTGALTNVSANIPTTASDINAVEANANITAGTATKITYDTKGLVTSGTSLLASDIPDLSATYATTGALTNVSANIPTTASDINAVEANADITAGTATKITYDAKGLVTSGTSLSASDIPDLSANYATIDSISNITSTIATAYSNTSTYSYFDHVTYNNLLYYCNQSEGITTAEEWTAAHWTQITVSSELFILDPDQSPVTGSILFRNADNTKWRATNASSFYLRGDDPHASFALGGGTTGDRGMGIFGTATGDRAIALGVNSGATGQRSVAIQGLCSGWFATSIDSPDYGTGGSAMNTQQSRTAVGGKEGIIVHGNEGNLYVDETEIILPENIGILDIKNGYATEKDKLIVCRDSTLAGAEIFSVLKDGALQSLYDETNKEATTAQTLAIISGRTYLYGSPASLTISSINGGADISSTLGRNEITILIDEAVSGFTLTMTALTTGAMGLILPSGITHSSGVISGFTAGSTYVITIKNKILRIEVVSDFYDPEG